MGSRYGGLKQTDAIGPNGEAIIDYSVYDAIQAGFGKVVFVIRKNFAGNFIRNFQTKLAGKITAEFVFQELDNIPVQADIPVQRKKPLGTAHAVWVAHQVIDEPFAVINADDFYGKESFKIMAQYLTETVAKNPNYFAMIGYQLQNTLSGYGYVSRGICQIDKNDLLQSVVEKTHIEKKEGKIIAEENEQKEIFTGNEIVSMNFWGFSPALFPYLEEGLKDFMIRHSKDLESEFYLPSVVNRLINQRKVKVKVLKTPEKWFGITYKKDKKSAVSHIQNLIQQGIYPENLWNL